MIRRLDNWLIRQLTIGGNPIANDALTAPTRMRANSRPNGKLSDGTTVSEGCTGVGLPDCERVRHDRPVSAAGLSEQCRLRHEGDAYIRPVTDLELVTCIDPNGANATRTANAVADHWFTCRPS